ncbi:transmembrane protein 177 [Polypterus senegalus]|nr:transmembrane protein 177 [Polypterus senegalus]
MLVRLSRRLVPFVHKYRNGLLIASCGGVFSVSIFYHVFPEQTYKKIYQAWSQGQPAVLSENLQNLFQEVLKETKVRSPQNYRAFAAFGFHPISAGIPWMPGRAHVGIPANFNSTTEGKSGIKNRVVIINGKEVDWEGTQGALLKEALTFSPEAKKFALARELSCLEISGPVLYAAVAPACLAATWFSGVVIKQMFGLYARPVAVRGLVNLAVALLGSSCYFLASDAVNQWLEYHTDRKVASLSEEYARGGVEFYDKILARNRTLRVLMGRKGEEMYAPSGNLFPKHWIRLKYAPYTARKERLLRILNRYRVHQQ